MHMYRDKDEAILAMMAKGDELSRVYARLCATDLGEMFQTWVRHERNDHDTDPSQIVGALVQLAMSLYTSTGGHFWDEDADEDLMALWVEAGKQIPAGLARYRAEVKGEADD